MDSKKLEPVAQVTPYEGDKDFIFISYSHRDTATVLPLLQRMKEEGYRFWYDEGIDPGTEWPESIAAHLSRCRVCLAFMSATSLASHNCRREINFALSKNKEFLSVILEPVEMSPGMEMQISTYQSILKYKYNKEELFLQRLLSVDLLQNCREPRKVEPVSPPAPPVQPAESGGPQRSITQEGNGQAPKPPASSPGLKKWIPFAAAGTAILLVVAIAVFALGGSRSTGEADDPGAVSTEKADPGASSTWETDPGTAGTEKPDPGSAETTPGGIAPEEELVIDGTVYQDDLITQTITETTLSVQQLRTLAAFEKCIQLCLEDCTLESGALEALSAMEPLRVLVLENCQGVGDLSFLNALPKLYNLHVINCGVTDEQLAGFGGEHITALWLSDNALTTVPELADPARVTELSLAGNSIDDLTALSAWTKLRWLNVSGCGLTSLEGIEELQSIRELYAADNRLTDLTPLTKLIYLDTLDLKNNSIASLAPLLYCQQLSTVSLRNNPDCTDLEILSGSAATLTRLDVSGLKLPDDSLAFLSGSVKLFKFYAEGCGLKSCAGLEDSAELMYLSLANNSIQDVSPLAGLKKLTYLNLGNNQITSLPDLGHVGVDATFPIYVLSDNKLQSLNNLPDLDYFGLMVNGNPLADLSVLARIKGTRLAFDCTEETPIEQLEGTNISAFYVTSLFIGKQAQLERIKGNSHYVTPEEAYATIVDGNTGLNF